MADHLEPVRVALAALEDQRQRIDAAIAGLRLVLDGEGGNPVERAPAARASRPAFPASGARAEILALLENGEPMSALEIAQARGTSRNAAYAALQRMLDEPVPLIEKVDGSYRRAWLSGYAQGSPPAEAGGESEETREED